MSFRLRFRDIHSIKLRWIKKRIIQRIKNLRLPWLLQAESQFKKLSLFWSSLWLAGS